MGRKFGNTNEFAQLIGCKSESVRRALCLKGDYLGIVPAKLPNGRLLWPLDEVERVIESSQRREC